MVEEVTVCVTKERMRQALEVAFTTDADIEPLFNPTTWIDQAVRGGVQSGQSRVL